MLWYSKHRVIHYDTTLRQPTCTNIII